MADDHFEPELTISATEFKAKCLEIFDQLRARKIERLTITKRGEPVAVMISPEAPAKLPSLYGCMKGTVTLPPDLDLTAPIFEGTIDAELGILHN